MAEGVPIGTWRLTAGVKTLYIEPGSPWENGYIESFNGKLRDEMLNVEIFDTLLEARALIERWRRVHNTIRPHSSLDYRPPDPRRSNSGHLPSGLRPSARRRTQQPTRNRDGLRYHDWGRVRRASKPSQRIGLTGRDCDGIDGVQCGIVGEEWHVLGSDVKPRMRPNRSHESVHARRNVSSSALGELSNRCAGTPYLSDVAPFLSVWQGMEWRTALSKSTVTGPSSPDSVCPS